MERLGWSRDARRLTLAVSCGGVWQTRDAGAFFPATWCTATHWPVSADGQTLVMASTTGAVWASADAAESWHTIARDLPPVAAVWFVG